MLVINSLHVTVDHKEVVKRVTLNIRPGEIHALMGPNGSGKSSLAMAIAGHPRYEVAKEAPVERSPLPWSPSTRRGIASTGFGRTSDFSRGEKSGSSEKSKIELDGVDLTNLTPDQRARMGLFLAMQYPISIDGITVEQLLRRSVQEVKGQKSKVKNTSQNPKIDVLEFRRYLEKLAEKVGVTKELLHRSLNVGFSGGEKKRLEILQMLVLRPKYAILDETDSGLDVDAMRTIATAVKNYVSVRSMKPFGLLESERPRSRRPELMVEGHEARSNGPRASRHEPPAVLIITHYARLLKYLKPDAVHVMIDGKITETGGRKLAEKIEEKGYGENEKK